MRILQYLQSHLERYLLRGALYQLLAVGALIGLISLIAGFLAELVHAEGDLPEPVWWAFLRLTDPGYLGDDVGVTRRLIATVVTVLGYVLFMGSLVAIMTQWLHRTMRRLEAGHTPIARNNHIVLLGWTQRVPLVVKDLFLSETTVARFLRRRGARKMHIVVLANTVTSDLLREIRTEVGAPWDADQITLRSGNPLRMEHLERCDFLHASVVIVPAGEITATGVEQVDTRTIKSLMTMSQHPRVSSSHDLPLVVAELLDGRKLQIARSAYRGPLELVASDVVVARLVAQSIRHFGFSKIYSELLTHQEGNEIFARDVPQLVGKSVAELRHCFPTGIFMGLVRRVGNAMVPMINPAPDIQMLDDDRCIVMARSHFASEPKIPAQRRVAAAPFAGDLQPPGATPPELPTSRRVLIVGWNWKVPAILAELAEAGRIAARVDCVSAVPASQRSATVEHYGISRGTMELRYIDADIMSMSDLRDLHPHEYDNIVLVASDWLESGEEADARTLVAYLCLRQLLHGHARKPPILLELLDAGNVSLLGDARDDVLLTPVILGHMLTQVALRRELNVVFDSLFGKGDAEITFEDPRRLGYLGRSLSFAEISEQAWARGVTALGILRSNRGARPSAVLNPPADSMWELQPEDELVVLAVEPE